jgi:hypothetical protein
VYRAYTKEWCGFKSDAIGAGTILLCMPCTLIYAHIKKYKLTCADFHENRKIIFTDLLPNRTTNVGICSSNSFTPLSKAPIAMKLTHAQ